MLFLWLYICTGLLDSLNAYPKHGLFHGVISELIESGGIFKLYLPELTSVENDIASDKIPRRKSGVDQESEEEHLPEEKHASENPTVEEGSTTEKPHYIMDDTAESDMSVREGLLDDHEINLGQRLEESEDKGGAQVHSKTKGAVTKDSQDKNQPDDYHYETGSSFQFPSKIQQGNRAAHSKASDGDDFYLDLEQR